MRQWPGGRASRKDRQFPSISWGAERACQSAGQPRIALEIFEAQDLVVIVVGENLGVPAPVDNGVEHALGLLFREMILEFAQEACRRRAVTGALIEHPADMGRQRHVL